MGMFLSMTSIVGKTKDEVANSLSNYAKTVGGGLEKENFSIDNNNCCVIEEVNGNTTVFNPYAYLEHISKFSITHERSILFCFNILWTVYCSIIAVNNIF